MTIKKIVEKEIQRRAREHKNLRLSKHYKVWINKNGDLVLQCGKVIHGYIKVTTYPCEKSLFRD